MESSPAPPNANIIDFKWVYKLKYNPDGTIAHYKARLVAKGFTQTHGLDYFETFILVVKASTIRIVLALAISYNWTIRQLDVQNAFLNSDLQEWVFMLSTVGFLLTSTNLTKPFMGLSELLEHGTPSSVMLFLAGVFKFLVQTTPCSFFTLPRMCLSC